MFHHRRTIPPMYTRSGRGGFPPVNPRGPLVTVIWVWTIIGLVIVLAGYGWPALAAVVLAFLAWAGEDF